MSAPVRIEARAWGDVRFATLARVLGLADPDHAIIKVARLWSWQTEHYDPAHPTYVIDRDTIESVLGVGGPEALVRAKLATETLAGWRMHGTEGAIEWCWGLTAKRAAAGRARADGARRDARGRLTGNGGNSSPANHQHVLDVLDQHPPAQSSAPAPDPAPSPDTGIPDPPIVPQGGRGRKGKAGPIATDAEIASVRVILDKLGAENNTSYRMADEHVRLIVHQLRAGVTELELRAVVAHCAGLKRFQGDGREYLTPETLFGPKTITRYLDPARSAYRHELEARSPQPSLPINGHRKES